MKKTAAYIVLLLAAGMLSFHTAQAQERKVDLRKANIQPSDVEAIRKILGDAAPDSYNLAYEKDGKSVTNVGSASYRQISTVKGFSNNGNPHATTDILTTISNWVKTIYTNGFEKAYPEKVRAINQILETAAARP